MSLSVIEGQKAFAEALLDRSAPVPEGLTSYTGPRPPRRFAVYRNNVSSALVESLAIRYPVVRRIVGADFFRAMARDYALKAPPASPVLIAYGESFPDFIVGFGPAASLPYLPDVARLESAHWQAYHAADAEPLSAEAFAAIAPERLPAARFSFLPSMRLVPSRFPIVAIWRSNTHDEEISPIDLQQPEDALVVRPHLDVEIRKLPAGAHAFLGSLKSGAPLGSAASAQGETFDLAANLAGLVSARIVTRIDA